MKLNTLSFFSLSAVCSSRAAAVEINQPTPALIMKTPAHSFAALLFFLLPAIGFSAITALTSDSPLPLTGSPAIAAGSSASFQITGLGSSAGVSDNFRFGGANNATGFLTADYTISTTGGAISSVGNNLQGGRVKGIGITTGAGVRSFTVSLTYDRYLHGLLTGSTSAQNPWLMSMLPGTPDGFEYGLEIEYSDIATILTNGTDDTIANGTAHLGLAPTNPLVSDHVVTYKTNLASAGVSAPVTTFSGSGASQTITTTATLDAPSNWVGLNSVRPNPPSAPWNFTGSSSDFNSLSDPAELTDGNISRIQQISARTVSFTFTAISGGGVFPEGTEFTTSQDGRQEVAIQEALAALSPIPEPSRVLLLAMAGGSLFWRRRR